MTRTPRRPASRARRLAAFVGAGLLALLVPALVLAHPLGNFTINHFAGIRISADRVALDVVIDRAEIPAFQEQQRIDTDRDGVLSPGELDRERHAACTALTSDLRVAVDGRALAPRLVAAGLSTPTGAGGLLTMRLVCEYEAISATPIASTARVSFEDRSFPERIGWREIVVVADEPGAGGVSSRLTAYPADLLTQPL